MLDAAVVLSMLTALEAKPGQRVLEIGTGTGYSAALLAHRLGSRNVISMEIDPGIAGQARAMGAARLSELVEHPTSAVESITSLCPEEITSNADSEFTVGLFLADVQYSIARDDAQPGTYELLLYGVAKESAATVQVTQDHLHTSTFPVHEHGTRQLWNEAETAHA